MTPQEIRDQVKMKHPDFYGTPTQLKNVDKGNYKDIDHALLSQIYSLTSSSNIFRRDRNVKPMKISLERFDQSPEQSKCVSKSSSGYEKRVEPKVKYDDKIKEILSNADKYHRAYYKADTFHGPSLYFHHRALSTRHEPASLPHIEYVYATLASWGMHRMGKGGSKMQSFEIFCQGIIALKGRIAKAQGFDAQEISDDNWGILKEIFFGINAMASGTSIVGNSKVMHHMLPNVIPPIDREYTLRFLRGNTTIKNDLEKEWLMMKEIITHFFVPISSNTNFYSMAKYWMKRHEEYPWDTSIFKIIDNLIIGAKKQNFLSEYK